MATLLDAPKPANSAKIEEFVHRQLNAARRRVRVLDFFMAGLIAVVATTCFLLIVQLIDRAYETPPKTGYFVWGGFGLLSLAYIYWMFFRPSRREINPYYAARQLENHVESAKNSLVTWVDFEDDAKLAASIRTAISQKAAKDLKGLDLNQAIENKNLLWLGIPAIVLLLANAVVAFLPPTRTSLVLDEPTNGNVTVFNNQEVKFQVRVRGRIPAANSSESVRLRLWYNSEDPETYEERPLTVSETDKRLFSLTIPPRQVRMGFQYRILAGNASTPDYTVTCKIIPEFTGFDVNYEYPTYLKRPSEQTNDPNLIAPYGAVANLVVHTNRDVKGGHLEVDGQAKLIQGQLIEGQADSLKFVVPMEKETQYRVWFVTTEGDKNTDPKRFRIGVIDPKPVFQAFDISYEFPAYLRWKPVDLVNVKEPEIEGLRGTKVTITAKTNRGVKSAQLQINGQPPIIGTSIPDEPMWVRFQLPDLDQDGTAKVTFAPSSSENPALPKQIPIRALIDQPPSAQLDFPKEEEVTIAANGTLELSGVAADDHGIDGMTLRMKLVGVQDIMLEGKPYRNGISFLRKEDNSWPTRVEYKDFVKLPDVRMPKNPDFRLTPGSTVEYWLEAKDNCTVPPGPNVGRSASKRFKVIAPIQQPAEKAKVDQRNQELNREQQNHEKVQDEQLKNEKRPENQPPLKGQENQPPADGNMNPMPKDGMNPMGNPMPKDGMNPMGNPTPKDGMNPMGNPMPKDGMNPMGNPMPKDGMNPMGNPTPKDGMNPMGNPMPKDGMNPMGNPTPKDGMNPMGNPMPKDGMNPMGNPTPKDGMNPMGNPMPKDGMNPMGNPMPKDGMNPMGNPTPKDGANNVPNDPEQEKRNREIEDAARKAEQAKREREGKNENPMGAEPKKGNNDPDNTGMNPGNTPEPKKGNNPEKEPKPEAKKGGNSGTPKKGGNEENPEPKNGSGNSGEGDQGELDRELGELNREINSPNPKTSDKAKDDMDRLMRNPQTRQKARDELDKIEKNAKDELTRKKAQDLKKSGEEAAKNYDNEKPTQEKVDELAKKLDSKDPKQRKDAEQRLKDWAKNEETKKELEEQTDQLKKKRPEDGKKVEQATNKPEPKKNGNGNTDTPKPNDQQMKDIAKDLQSNDPMKQQAAKDDLEKMMKDPKTREQAKEKLDELAKKAQNPEEKNQLEKAAKQADELAKKEGDKPAPKTGAKVDPKDLKDMADKLAGKDEAAKKEAKEKLDEMMKDPAKREEAKKQLDEMAKNAKPGDEKKALEEMLKQANEMAKNPPKTDPKDLKDLMDKLKDTDPKAREQAKEKLQEAMKDPKIREQMEKLKDQMAKNEQDPEKKKQFDDLMRELGKGSNYEDTAKPEAADPKNRLKAAELMLDKFKKNLTDEEFNKTLNWTAEQKAEWLRKQEATIEALKKQAEKGDWATNRTVRPTTDRGPTTVQFEPKNTVDPLRGGRYAPPSGYADPYKKFTEGVSGVQSSIPPKQ